jgi:hypothetical protein
VVPNGVELQKTTHNEPSPPKSEGRFQARQLKEAGASTLSQSVVINDVNSRSLKVSPQDQDEDFKPANETQDGGDITGECYKKSFKGGLTTQDSRSLPINENFEKQKCLGAYPTELRESFLKNSTKANSRIFQNCKSVEASEDHPKNQGNLGNADASSGQSHTNSTGEDKKSKRNRAKKKASLEKGKSSQSRKTYAESSSEEPPVSIRRISKDKAEQICLMWIKSLNEIQAKINMENSKAHSDKDMPVYCSNRICPISKDKIQKTPRVLKQLQKVRMNKVHIENEYMEDDRWYCHKCLEAHQHSLYCQYCSQIYFLEEEGLEDEGKTWICCDK